MILYLVYRNYKIDDCTPMDFPAPSLEEICLSEETANQILAKTQKEYPYMDCWIYPREAKP